MKIENVDIAIEGIVHCILTYKDGSVKFMRTTLNPTILADYGVSKLTDSLLSIDRLELVSTKFVDKVTFSLEEPMSESEVVNFVNRFI